MPRARSSRVELKPYTNARRPNFKWVVYWPAEEPGKPRKSKRFKTKKDASAFAEQKQIDVYNQGAEGGAVHGDAVQEAKWALKALAPYGVTIREAVESFIARREEMDRSSVVRDAVDEFIAAKQGAGASERYLRDLRGRLDRFREAFGERIVCDITPKELSAWLEKLALGPVSRNNFRRNLGVFFNWAMRSGYCRGNPAKMVERVRKKPQPVEIFDAGELRVILDHAPDELRPALAIGAFAGLRMAEIGRLDWSEVNFRKGHVEVAAEKSKTASRRFVPMEPALRAWLEPLARVTGPVAPRRLDEKLTAYRRTIAEEARDADGVVIRPKVVWKSNGLRHSYASYAIAREENADRVALWLGHTSATMTFQAYQERATREEAEAWFAVRPKDAIGQGSATVATG